MLLMTDLALRFMAIGAMILMCFTLLLRSQVPRGAIALTALCATAVAHLIVSVPEPVRLEGAQFAIVCTLVSFAPLAMTFTVFEMLSPDRALRIPALVIATATVVAWNVSPFFPPVEWLGLALKLVLFGGIMWIAIQADGDDLVPRRRRLRRVCTAMMAALGLFAVGMQVFQTAEGFPIWVHLFESASYIVVVLCFASHALSPDTDLWPQPEVQTRKPTGEGARVEALMASGIWRREGLTVAQMAQELELPEHRLRQIINQDLGQRNFSGFINAARIQSARASLEDPSQSRRTVLEIAYEVGFASLGPFNRAFKDQTGLTPTAYRAQARDDRSNITDLPISKIPVKSA